MTCLGLEHHGPPNGGTEEHPKPIRGLKKPADHPFQRRAGRPPLHGVETIDMKRLSTEINGALVRSKGFLGDHPVTPAIPRVTALGTEMDTLITDYGAAGANQVGGLGLFRGSSTHRKVLSNQIYTVLFEMSAIAQGLDPIDHPGIADRFRLGNSRRSYQGLINTGAAFVEAMEDPAVKALFTDRGFAATFDTELTASLVAFAAATGRKFDGLRDRKEGTVSLYILDRKAIRLLKELRAIVEKHLRQNNPELLEVWEAASRVYRGRDVEEEETPVGGGSGTGTTPPASGS